MKNFKKHISLAAFIVFVFVNAFGQEKEIENKGLTRVESGRNFELNNTDYLNKLFVCLLGNCLHEKVILEAKDYVKFNNGFKFIATSNKNASARINEQLILPSDYVPSEQLANLYNRDITQNPIVAGVTGNIEVTDKGAGTYSIPIMLPTGTNGFVPKLNIEYNSHLGSGNLGIGWFVNCENKISRMQIPGQLNFNNSDKLSFNGNKLVPEAVTSTNKGELVYFTENPTFAKIIASGDFNNPNTYFTVLMNDGTVLEYGNNSNSKLMVQDLSGNYIPYSWSLNKVTDPNGNTMIYDYYNSSDIKNGQILLKSISYCNNESNTAFLNEVIFSYDEFDQGNNSVLLGSNIFKNNYIINKIKINSGNTTVNEYNFAYVTGENNPFPRLVEISNKINDAKINSCLVEWGEKKLLNSALFNEFTGSQLNINDYNGDGIDDYITGAGNSTIYVNLSKSFINNIVTYDKVALNPTYSYEPNGYNIIVGNFDDNLDTKEILIAECYSYPKPDKVKFNLYVYDKSTQNFQLKSLFNFPEFGTFRYSYVYSHNGGDFNGDNLTDFFINCVAGDDSYKSLYLSNTNGYYSVINANSYTINNDFSNLKVGNVFGDSKDEYVCYIPATSSYYVQKFEGSGFTSFFDDEKYPYTTDMYCDLQYKYIPPNSFVLGDYNNDGYDDIIIPDGNVLLSNGINNLISGNKYSQTSNCFQYQNSVGMYFYVRKPFVCDINGDGVNDVLHLNGIDFGFNNNNNVTYANFYIDFNADGVKDVVTKLSNSQLYIQSPSYNYKNTQLVKNITDGFGVKHSFEYGDMLKVSNYAAPLVLNNQTVNQPQLKDYRSYKPLVTKLTTKKKGFTNNLQYTYKRPFASRNEPNNFLGFFVVEFKDDFNIYNTRTSLFDIKYNLENSYEEKHFISPYIVDVLVTYNNTNIISKVTKIPDVAKFKNQLYVYTSKISNTDVYGNVSSTDYSKPDLMDNVGQRTVIITKKYSSGIEEKTTNTYYSDNSSNNSWRFGALASKKIEKKHPDDGDVVFVDTYGYAYDKETFGNLKSIKINDILTDEYIYHTNGTLKEHKKSTRSISNTYDEFGRFKISITDNTKFKPNDANENKDVIFLTYDAWGNKLTEKSSINPDLITKFIYTPTGKLSKEIYANGKYKTYTTSWASSSDLNNALYKTNTTSSDGYNCIIQYNATNNELKIETSGFDNKKKIITKNYFPNEMLKSESLPYFSVGGSEQLIEYTYDAKGRISTKIGPSINETYDYSTGSTSEHTVSVIKNNNGVQLTTKTIYDDAGQIKEIVEPLAGSSGYSSSIKYKYYASGLLKSVNPTSNENTAVVFYYDKFGKKIGTLDPSMGSFDFDYGQPIVKKKMSIVYSYNFWGELTGKTDAKGNKYEAVYFNKGVIQDETYTDKDGVVKKVDYKYYLNGHDKNRLESIIYNNIEYKYTYDNFGNILTKNELIDIDDNGIKEEYAFVYTYDNLDRLLTKKYPTGLTIRYNYENEFLKSITNDKTGDELWSVVKMNDQGNYTQIKKGSGKYETEFKYDDNNKLDYIKTTANGAIIQNLDYDFNEYNFNLNSRSDKIQGRNISESFIYDNIDRLETTTLVSGNNTNTSSIVYSESNTPAVIQSKTGLGVFQYEKTDKPYQLTTVENTDGLVQTAHSITYNEFNRVTEIKESNKKLSIIYGPNCSKKISKLEINNNPYLTRVYVDEFEIEINEQTGEIRELCYINSPTGIIGVIEKIGNKAESMYYVFTDHLGSWNVIADANGNKIADQEMSFDAWGNRRNVDNWSNNSNLRYKFYKGFTGHEHWDDLGLIDMNARFYDPILGMFVSLDPYVQAPNKSQNFNRYTYCLNNPLKYTDKTGEFFGLVAAAWLLLSEDGYEIQKYLSPVALHIDANFGSGKKSLGVDASIGMPKAAPVAARVNIGASYVFDYYDNAYKGWEFRRGAEVKFGMVTLSTTQFDMEGSKFDQHVGMITIGGPFVNFKFENDVFPAPLGDKGDRYRTAAARLKVGPLKVGTTMFTGDPGLTDKDRTKAPKFSDQKYLTYLMGKNGENPDEYRFGSFYFAIGPLSFGTNTEGNRNMFQNYIAHDLLGDYPSFHVLDRKDESYWNFGYSNGTTLY